MTSWLSPRDVARARSIRVGKVLAWIRSGELEAVNCAEKRTGAPRWRISIEALEAFDRVRSNRGRLQPAPPRRRRRVPESVVEFF